MVVFGNWVDLKLFFFFYFGANILLLVFSIEDFGREVGFLAVKWRLKLTAIRSKFFILPSFFYLEFIS